MPRHAVAPKPKKKTAAWSDLPADYLPGEGVVWLVVGGRGGAGITVRRGQSLKTQELPARLSHGARIEQVDLEGDRLRYRRLTGDGPDFGWVSLSYKGAPLLKIDDIPCEDVIPQPTHPPLGKKPPNPIPGSKAQRPAYWRKDLPEESADWTSLESSLFVQSGGWYHPGEMAKMRREPADGRVSVVTPTSEARQTFHEQLCACFLAQDWPDKELIVIESFAHFTSQRFTSEARRPGSVVTHIPFKGELSIGLKRNMGVHLASGKYVVQFDDDDLYAPSYISKMIKHMESNNLAALTLGTWYNCELHKGTFGFVDPESFRPFNYPDVKGTALEAESERVMQEAKEARRRSVDPIVYGYGFSYAYLRDTAYAYPFPDVSMSEDYEFMRRLRCELGDGRVGLLQDHDGICLHLLHRHNSAGSDSDREATSEEVEGLEVRGLDIVDARLQLVLVGVNHQQAGFVLEAMRELVSEPPLQRRIFDFHSHRHTSAELSTFLREHVYLRVCGKVNVPREGIWPEVLFEKLELCCKGDAELQSSLEHLQKLLKSPPIAPPPWA
mmetsp:Transcript_110471/g.323162  ORF Transcript_110471/g.323162 Transcript_110471/m.323162 type:complete len:554 (-) Transcript_110471:274-1935(-)